MNRGRKVCDSGRREEDLLYLDSRTAGKVGLSFSWIPFSSLRFSGLALGKEFADKLSTFELIVTCIVSISRCDFLIVIIVCRASHILESRYTIPGFFVFSTVLGFSSCIRNLATTKVPGVCDRFMRIIKDMMGTNTKRAM